MLMMKEVTIKNSGATFTPTELADFLADKLIAELKSYQKLLILFLIPLVEKANC
jgi:hypothetical protein